MLRLWYPLHAIRLDRYPVTWLDSRASRLVMNGVDIYSVHKLLRHETLQVTKRYAHLADTHLQRAAELIGG